MRVQIVRLKSNGALKIVNRVLIPLLLGVEQCQIFQQNGVVWPLLESLKPFTLRTRHVSPVPINGPEVRASETAIMGRSDSVANKALLVVPNRVLAHRLNDAN